MFNKTNVWLIFAFLVITGCEDFVSRHEVRNFMRIDTVVTVTLVLKKEMDLDEIWDRIDKLLVDWQGRFSQTHPKSEVRHLNQNSGDTVLVSPVLAEMLVKGTAYGDTLQGAFDLTILPLKDLWGLGENASKAVIPSAQEIDQVLPRVDYRKVFVNEKSLKAVITNPATKVDVGGIAKSYVLVDLARLLDSLGFKDFLLVAGGDVLGSGKRHDGAAWKIAVQHPRNPKGYLGTVSLEKGSIVTSGDYERFWEKDGKRYHHIFDPRTGYPCNANRSLTIWSENTIEADILSTGLFCRDADSIMSFVNQRVRLEAIIMDSLGSVSISEGWKNKVKLF